MTKEELFAVWARYAHRNDLTADMETTYLLAAERVNERLMIAEPDVDAILANSPRSLVHAGLAYLHNLAQDDEGLVRENQLFEVAIGDYAMRSSINNVDPVMIPEHDTNGTPLTSLDTNQTGVRPRS